MRQLEERIARYIDEFDRADRQPAAVLPSRVTRLKEKIAKVKEQVRALEEIGKQVNASAEVRR